MWDPIDSDFTRGHCMMIQTRFSVRLSDRPAVRLASGKPKAGGIVLPDRISLTLRGNTLTADRTGVWVGYSSQYHLCRTEGIRNYVTFQALMLFKNPLVLKLLRFP